MKGYFIDQLRNPEDVSDLANYPKGVDWTVYSTYHEMLDAMGKKIPDCISIGEDDAFLALSETLHKLLQAKKLDKVRLYFHSHKTSTRNALTSYYRGFKVIVGKERSK